MIFKKFDVKTFLDAPCGDANWQHEIPGIASVQYTGADIVSDEITSNMRKRLALPNFRFVNLDLVQDVVPKDLFDVALVRDVIQHLPLQDGLKIYRNIEESGVKYLVTNFHDPRYGKINKNITPGDFFQNNPMIAPFNFAEPLFYTVDMSDAYMQQVPTEKKYVAVWKLPAVGLGNGTAFTPDLALARKGPVAVSEEGRRILQELGLGGES
ncbi:hypothetical protein HKX48_000777 [Thoreauomyces humboldtii]|nr:hypothetical protein HKX48_000777 [Thoreauomyces humboldtii]